MLKKAYVKSQNVCKVTFTIPTDQLPQYFEVKTAAVVADFNNWSIAATPMTHVADVGFVATVELTPNQSYEYRYVLNDTAWYNDWAADGYVPNRLQTADNCVVSLVGIVEDDLTKILGVGPKIAGLIKADGITTYAQLAMTSVEQLQDVLDAAGKRYRMAVPTTWPQQAALAASGEWDKLSALQAELDGGRPA